MQVTSALSIVHPILLSHGQNATVWDTDGQAYIDFIGGIGVLNLGHCHPKIVAAIVDQAQKLTHYAYNAAPHGPYQALMAALSKFIPTRTPMMGMLTNCGAEATENALKIARIHTGRTVSIAFDGGFHGRTLAALNLNGKVAPYKQGLGPLPGPVYHLPFPSPDNGISCQMAIAALERLIQVEIDVKEIASIFVEPVQGEAGFQLLDRDFARYLRSFCDEHGIVLVLDEIQSGFGRTGKPFAFEHLGIEPDVLLLAKSIAGGMPLGAVMGKPHLMDNLPKGSLGGTYSGNPVACAAALATIEILSDRDSLKHWGAHYEKTVKAHHAQWLKEGLTCVAPLTGIGAMRGIPLITENGDPNAKLLAELLPMARERGLLLMPSGKHRNIIRLLAPLTIEPEQLEAGLTILGDCLHTITKPSMEK
ncbi:4-aminobutyrate aminotransferase GabT [Wohlfahrtiimonas chitiniclastica SH04]|uniref:4-aminobutyrate aminotransferase GabT n=1 Tax=Wohlfahrtiimonas chitiniclastica SH04 TaxID=1261130 RepID=L8Y1N0_9GAMM|nr:aspartate aminotransferase family protein [Wohlfahrtiimonas chitiniclastica]ELV08391.1 4-aminobutyrate aminotransferase GabT [Wohlfahrtiimonas chitiniclastica SH04]